MSTACGHSHAVRSLQGRNVRSLADESSAPTTMNDVNHQWAETNPLVDNYPQAVKSLGFLLRYRVIGMSTKSRIGRQNSTAPKPTKETRSLLHRPCLIQSRPALSAASAE